MAEPFPVAYLNGEFVPLKEARVSPLDRAFLYADSVYEVMPVYGGRVFRFREHFDRLDRSLAELQMRPAYSRQQWATLCDGLIARNGGGDMYLYVQVSRGAEYGRNHAPLPDIERTVFAFASALPPLTRERLDRGVAAVTAEDTRWSRCDIKSTALLANVLLKQLAVDANAAETILIRDGRLMEGASTTVHVVRGGEIHTPPKSHSILPGTTRDVVSELATRSGIPFRAAPVTATELKEAPEVFIAAATIGTLAVTRLDGQPVGAGVPGPVWKQIHAAFESYKRELAGTPAY
jgi:D-alanine transaminase